MGLISLSLYGPNSQFPGLIHNNFFGVSDWNRIRKRGRENFTWDRGESEGESEDRCGDESEHERPLARPPSVLDRPWPFCSRKNGRDSSRDISHTQFVWGPYFPPSVVPIQLYRYMYGQCTDVPYKFVWGPNRPVFQTDTRKRLL